MKKILITTAIAFLMFASGTYAQLRVAGGSNVGIGGVTNPTQKLEINGNALMQSTNKIYFNNTNRYIGLATSIDLGLINKESTWLRIGSNLGIAFWGHAGAEATSSPNPDMFLNSIGLGIGSNAQAFGTINFFVQGNGQFTGTLSWGSDKRFKQNIRPIENSLDKVLKLKGSQYEYNREAFKDFNFPTGSTFGFIAQELKEVFPEMVSEDNKGYLAINYIAMIPVLTEAIKDQQNLIEEKNTDIKNLRSQVGLLSEKISSLEKSLGECCTSFRVDQSGTTSVSVNSDKAKLDQNAPNPFSEKTVIKYYLPLSTSNAEINIFSLDGDKLKTYKLISFGQNQITVSEKSFKSGSYVYQLIVNGEQVDSKIMTLTK